MKQKLFRYTVLGFLFVSILGTLAHFFYEWSGQQPVIALFTPVNESIWEHIKLLFFPMLLFSWFMNSRFHQTYPAILCSLFTGLLAGCLFIPVSFYTYTGIIGYNITTVDITIFYLSVLLTFWIAYHKIIDTHRKKTSCFLTFFMIFIMTVLFFIFTFYPPAISLFQSP